MSEIAIRLHIEPLEEGGYVATSPDVQGLVAEGRTVSETVEIARELARVLIDMCIEQGDPLPPAVQNAKTPVAVDVIVPVEVN
jgi:antitoxin HicB